MGIELRGLVRQAWINFYSFTELLTTHGKLIYGTLREKL